MHHKMYTQRTVLEGHRGYNIFRAADELLAYYDAKDKKLQIKTKEALNRIRDNRNRGTSIKAIMASDTNGDGLVNGEELQEDGMTQEDASRAIALFDTDGDGAVSYTELKASPKKQFDSLREIPLHSLGAKRGGSGPRARSKVAPM